MNGSDWLNAISVPISEKAEDFLTDLLSLINELVHFEFLEM